MIDPWENMKKNTHRRASSKINHNIFWFVDGEGKYGLFIQARGIHKNDFGRIRLKGITIEKKENNQVSELYIALNNNEEWQLFLSVCRDLIGIAEKYEIEEMMFKAVENRLKVWQKFLLKNKSLDFTLEKQMGLFGELYVLKEIIAPNKGLKDAVSGWVGPDFDKQDFLLDRCIVEVKSYKTSKTPIVTISSASQLYSDKQPLFLVAFGLTPSKEKGETVGELIEKIGNAAIEVSFELYELFQTKVFDYGFLPSSDVRLYKFIIDRKTQFEVTDSFPKITPTMIKSQILNVKYAIDLLQCSEFFVDDTKFEEQL